MVSKKAPPLRALDELYAIACLSNLDVKTIYAAIRDGKIQCVWLSGDSGEIWSAEQPRFKVTTERSHPSDLLDKTRYRSSGNYYWIRPFFDATHYTIAENHSGQ